MYDEKRDENTVSDYTVMTTDDRRRPTDSNLPERHTGRIPLVSATISELCHFVDNLIKGRKYLSTARITKQ
jgi:hypothetical protein